VLNNFSSYGDKSYRKFESSRTREKQRKGGKPLYASIRNAHNKVQVFLRVHSALGCLSSTFCGDTANRDVLYKLSCSYYRQLRKCIKYDDVRFDKEVQ